MKREGVLPTGFISKIGNVHPSTIGLSVYTPYNRESAGLRSYCGRKSTHGELI